MILSLNIIEFLIVFLYYIIKKKEINVTIKLRINSITSLFDNKSTF